MTCCSKESSKYLRTPWSQFHQPFTSCFCAHFLLQENTNPNCKHIKVAQNSFVQKSCSQNVGEIDT